jgi:hypothetical protein
MSVSPKYFSLTDECFYCPSKRDIRTNNITYNFGIKSCAYHQNNSVGDCNEYMKEKRIVPVKYAITHNKLKEFFDLLGDDFHFKRIGGEIHKEWRLDLGTGPIFVEFIVYDEVKGEWTIPVINVNVNIHKRIPIKDFLIPEILATFPEGTSEKIWMALESLDNGVY